MHISSTLTISPSLTVFEEISRRVCEAQLMENFTGFTRSLKDAFSCQEHERGQGVWMQKGREPAENPFSQQFLGSFLLALL